MDEFDAPLECVTRLVFGMLLRDEGELGGFQASSRENHLGADCSVDWTGGMRRFQEKKSARGCEEITISGF